MFSATVSKKKQDISHESVTTKISPINSAAIHSPLLSSDEVLYQSRNVAWLLDSPSPSPSRIINIFKIVDIMYFSLVLLLTIIACINGQNASYPDCRTGPLATFPICNPALPSRQRAVDLVSRMNTSEKISQLVHAAPAIPRLGLPANQWWSEALHGHKYFAMGKHHQLNNCLASNVYI